MTKTAKELIAEGEWINCKICEDVFARQRKTQRYCSACKSGFCEGEHGSMQHKFPKCVKCA